MCGRHFTPDQRLPFLKEKQDTMDGHFISIVALVILSQAVQGSEIHFDAVPSIISSGLTRTLKLRCSISDTLPGATTQTQTTPSPSENVNHIISVIVTRNKGDPVATVTSYDAASALADRGTMFVKGDVSSGGTTLPERGYLEILWMEPQANQTGTYTCEINAVNSLGHHVMFTAVTEVAIEFPTESEMVAHIHELEVNNTLQQHQIADLQKSLLALTQTVAALQPHSESGEVNCGNSNSWVSQSTGRERKIHVTFRKPYSRPPVVSAEVAGVDIEHSVNTRFNVDPINIDATGFDLVCHTWADTHLYNIRARWSSTLA